MKENIVDKDRMMTEEGMMDEMDELNFENYSEFMLFLNTYFERYLHKNMDSIVKDWPEDEYYVIRVTEDILQKIGIVTPWNEFTSMTVELQEELRFGEEENVLLKTTVEEHELKIELDIEIFKWMAESPPFEQ